MIVSMSVSGTLSYAIEDENNLNVCFDSVLPNLHVLLCMIWSLLSRTIQLTLWWCNFIFKECANNLPNLAENWTVFFILFYK